VTVMSSTLVKTLTSEWLKVTDFVEDW